MLRVDTSKLSQVSKDSLVADAVAVAFQSLLCTETPQEIQL